MGVIVVPRILQEKLGEDGSDAFVKVIKEIDLEARKEALVVAEEHFEVRLSEEMGKLRQELSSSKEEMRQEIGDLRVENIKTKADMIKWMFIFWIGQIGVLSGIMFAIFKIFSG